MRPVSPRLRPGIIAILLAASLVFVAPTFWRAKIFLWAVLSLTVPLKWGAWWSEGCPARRRAFFIGALFSPVVLLSIELFFAYVDWRADILARPLRLTTEFDQMGFLARSEACSFQLRASRDYDLWGGKVQIDGNGFRSDYEVAVRKDPTRIRVMLIGGSAAFGWGVPDGQDVAGHLRTILNGSTQGGRYEVINAAVPYYTSFHELNCYLHVLHAYHPDVLAVLSGRNDAHFAFEQGTNWRPVSEGKTGPSPFISLAPPPLEPEPFVSLQRFLMRSSLYRRYDALFPSLTPAPGKAVAPPTPPPADVNPAFVDQFVRHQTMLARATTDDGCRCILALQPVIHVAKPLAPLEAKYSKLWGDCGPHFRKFWPGVQAAAARLDVPGALAVDLTDCFADCKGDAYLDECHYTSEGNRLIARRLAGVIQSGFGSAPESQATKPTP